MKSKPIKKFLSLLLSLIMLTGITAGLDLSAYAYTSGDFEYDVLDDGTAEIYNYTGSATVLEIPSEIDGYAVTSIGDSAFYGCSSLTDITIPDSVTSIGWYAFWRCESLVEITIPSNVTSIGWFAFYGCASLTNIAIGSSVTSIGMHAFSGTAYYNNESNWENGVLYIGEYLIEADEDISGAYEVKQGTRFIAEYAFDYCESLAEITIPDSVTSIGGSAFADCTSLTNVTLGSSVTSIEWFTFAYCESLTEITIPDSVISIGDSAFQECTSLTDITIPDSVTSIGESAFAFCENLTEITIPDSVTSIGVSAFSGCTSLTEINVDENNTAYSSQDGVLFDKDKTELIQYPVGNERTSYTIPDGVESIGSHAFYYCKSLTEITMPNSVTSIGDYAFDYCDNLTIYGYVGSYAQTYANVYDIPFVALTLSDEASNGDVTGDGIIDAADVVMVQRYDAGLITLSAEQLEAADVTGDGIVDAADVVMIQRYDAGLISSL